MRGLQPSVGNLMQVVALAAVGCSWPLVFLGPAIGAILLVAVCPVLFSRRMTWIEAILVFGNFTALNVFVFLPPQVLRGSR